MKTQEKFDDEQSIVMSVSVCLSVCLSQLQRAR